MRQGAKSLGRMYTSMGDLPSIPGMHHEFHGYAFPLTSVSSLIPEQPYPSSHLSSLDNPASHLSPHLSPLTSHRPHNSHLLPLSHSPPLLSHVSHPCHPKLLSSPIFQPSCLAPVPHCAVRFHVGIFLGDSKSSQSFRWSRELFVQKCKCLSPALWPATKRMLHGGLPSTLRIRYVPATSFFEAIHPSILPAQYLGLAQPVRPHSKMSPSTFFWPDAAQTKIFDGGCWQDAGLVDEDELLSGAPAVKASPVPSCGEASEGGSVASKPKKACKNCSCGLKEEIGNLLPTSTTATITITITTANTTCFESHSRW